MVMRLNFMLQINETLEAKLRPELLLSPEDIALMHAVIDTLTPFETAIKEFEKEKEPTIHHVLPQYVTLKAKLKPKGTDSAVILKFKRQLETQLDIKLGGNIIMRHKMGAFFWPKFACSLEDLMSEAEKDEVIFTYHKDCFEKYLSYI